MTIRTSPGASRSLPGCRHTRGSSTAPSAPASRRPSPSTWRISSENTVHPTTATRGRDTWSTATASGASTPRAPSPRRRPPRRQSASRTCSRCRWASGTATCAATCSRACVGCSTPSTTRRWQRSTASAPNACRPTRTIPCWSATSSPMSRPSRTSRRSSPRWSATCRPRRGWCACCRTNTPLSTPSTPPGGCRPRVSTRWQPPACR